MRHPTHSLDPEEPSTLYLLNHRLGPSSNDHLPTSPSEGSQHRPLQCIASVRSCPSPPSTGFYRRRLCSVPAGTAAGFADYTKEKDVLVHRSPARNKMPRKEKKLGSQANQNYICPLNGSNWGLLETHLGSYQIHLLATHATGLPCSVFRIMCMD